MRIGAQHLLLVLAGACATAPRPPEIVLDRDDIEIRHSVVVRPGTYRVRDRNGDGVLHVIGDDVTVTLTGVTLDGAADGAMPDELEGVGITVVGGARVHLVGGALRGFRVGLRGERARDLDIDGVDVSGNRAMRLQSTPAREDASDWLWPHENDHGEWEARYGAGISLVDCERPSVHLCRARRTQNGLLLLRCREAAVTGNDFSFLSGWGIAMYRCTQCRVLQNRCDWCVRGYSHGIYARGQDSAGLLVFEQCSDNEFVGNSATHSGDGLFLYAGHETTQRTGAGGCNRNRVIGNDFSQAVANGIEATFSRDNEFVANRLDECEHGVWAGYSHATQIRENTIRHCANGVSIEHGHDNTIAANVLDDCGRGVHLWWDDDKDLLASVYGRTQETASTRNTIIGNWITGGGTALQLDGDTASRVEGNHVARAEDEPAAGDVTARPTVPVGATFLAADMPRGREHIVIDAWGPLDPRLPALVPFGPVGVDAATLRVVGAALPFVVVDLTDGFVASPAAGTGPAVLRVQQRRGSNGPSVAPWRAVVRIGTRDFRASGSLFTASWQVRWWAWQADPRTDPAAWQALLAQPPLDTATVAALDFAWGNGRPTANVPTDRFATVAETTCTVPSGTWRLHTVSDDGIRVWVDGKLAIDDWTWHAPKEITCDLALAAGPHTIRVEHFELDGWAALHCWLEPVTAGS